MAFFGRIQRAIAERRARAKESGEKKFLRNVERLEKLEQEKAETEKRKFTQDQIRLRKKEIRDIKTERARRVVRSVGLGLKKANTSRKKVRSSLGQNRTGFNTGTRDIFGTTRNVFSGEPEKKKEKPKTVTIKIQQ